MANIHYILYAFLLILASAINIYMDDNRYNLSNKEIVFNKWENIYIKNKKYNNLRGYQY